VLRARIESPGHRRVEAQRHPRFAHPVQHEVAGQTGAVGEVNAYSLTLDAPGQVLFTP
jgi:hypothetical protein